jgi:hypothetical protein
MSEFKRCEVSFGNLCKMSIFSIGDPSCSSFSIAYESDTFAGLESIRLAKKLITEAIELFENFSKSREDLVAYVLNSIGATTGDIDEAKRIIKETKNLRFRRAHGKNIYELIVNEYEIVYKEYWNRPKEFIDELDSILPEFVAKFME